jgi:TPR repeat protein
MDFRSATEHRLLRGLALAATLTTVGCLTGPTMMQCPRGQQSHDGQCVPTSTLVFERCLESFRKTRTEHDHGTNTEVQATVKGQGGSLLHERKDSEASEYDDLPPELMGDAIAECRRQEEVQRTLEVERAWAAAQEAERGKQDADARLAAAQRDQRRSEEAAARTRHAHGALKQEHATTERSLADALAALDEHNALLVEQHPCTAKAWDRCADQALAAKRDADYVQAHALYRQACEGGFADACGNWGVMFEHGLGVTVDLPESRRLYRSACDDGSPHGCANLAFLLEQGRGATRDIDGAATLYRTACDAGHMRGCGRLGWLVSTGALHDEALPSAPELLDRACEGDYPRACLWAAERDLDGRDGERRPERAARRLQRACEHDEPEACVTLGRLHELGDGVAEDPGQAAALYRRACEGNESRGCAAVERLSRGAESERNGERTQRW